MFTSLFLLWHFGFIVVYAGVSRLSLLKNPQKLSLLRFNESDSTPKAFLHPLRTASQRTSHPAPSPPYRKEEKKLDVCIVTICLQHSVDADITVITPEKLSRREMSQKIWTQLSRPGGRTPGASEKDQRVL